MVCTCMQDGAVSWFAVAGLYTSGVLTDPPDLRLTTGPLSPHIHTHTHRVEVHAFGLIACVQDLTDTILLRIVLRAQCWPCHCRCPAGRRLTA